MVVVVCEGVWVGVWVDDCVCAGVIVLVIVCEMVLVFDELGVLDGVCVCVVVRVIVNEKDVLIVDVAV